MSTESIQSAWICPECDRENRPSDTRCWLCFTPRTDATAVADRPPPRQPFADERDDDYPEPRPAASLFQRRLPVVTANSLLFVCLLLSVAYGLGLAMLLVLLPALSRLFSVARSRSAEPPPVEGETWRPTIAQVIAGPLIALLVIASAFITFVAVCFPAGLYSFENNSPYAVPVVVAGWVFGVLLACLVAYLIVFAFFRHKPRLCPRCGLKNSRTATECRYCRAPLSIPNIVQGR